MTTHLEQGWMHQISLLKQKHNTHAHTQNAKLPSTAFFNIWEHVHDEYLTKQVNNLFTH